MTDKERSEYEKLKGDSMNGTMSFDKAMRYFALVKKDKEGKANDKTRSKK
tara:strand:+ start:484 stop:633 length:150 start_codon:yes stop_codon:yes gene_type:complete